MKKETKEKIFDKGKIEIKEELLIRLNRNTQKWEYKTKIARTFTEEELEEILKYLRIFNQTKGE